jgi:dienelactone hydrolase
MRALRGFLLCVALLVAVLAGFALLLPRDATPEVLRLRGRSGRAEQQKASRNSRSSVRLVALRNDRGELLTTIWLRRPLALSPRYHVVITYAGADTGEGVLQLIPQRDDLVIAAVQYPWRPPHTLLGKLRAPYDIRQAAYRTIAGGMATVDVLERDEHLDPRRILLLGASLGSIFATIHGAIDSRVPVVILIHGGADLPSTLAAAMPHVPAWIRPLAVRLALIPIDTFDPARYVARISPRRLLIIAARDDTHFPAEAVRRFFAQAREPKELRWTNTGHVGKRNLQIVAVVIAELTRYFDAHGSNP